MLKKFFYFGLGLADLLYENFDELVAAGEERYNKLVGADQPIEETITIETVVSVEAVEDTEKDAGADDLTKISGIGPTFARRLQEAGITTYQALASSTANQVKEITHVADWQGDPDEWIVAAKGMA